MRKGFRIKAVPPQHDLDKAVPAFASWRLAELPRYLAAEQVDGLIAACDGSWPRRRRDLTPWYPL